MSEDRPQTRGRVRGHKGPAWAAAFVPGRMELAPVLMGLILLDLGIELALQIGDLLPVMARLRETVYENAAFWPGLLTDWTGNYPGQRWVMFVSYGFLHGGLGHAVFNMMTLGVLGARCIERIGSLRFLLLYLGAMIAGAGVFGLLSQGYAPMVGASGALFGLAGAILAWIWDDAPSIRAALAPVGRILLWLIGINVVMYLAMQGQLAWETHLGGFLAGWVLGLALDRTEDPPT